MRYEVREPLCKQIVGGKTSTAWCLCSLGFGCSLSGQLLGAVQGVAVLAPDSLFPAQVQEDVSYFRPHHCGSKVLNPLAGSNSTGVFKSRTSAGLSVFLTPFHGISLVLWEVLKILIRPWTLLDHTTAQAIYVLSSLHLFCDGTFSPLRLPKQT